MATLKDGMKRLQFASSPKRTHSPSYTPLPDVPVDAYTSHSISSSAAVGKQPNWLLTKPTRTSASPLRTVPAQDAPAQPQEQGDGRPGRGRLRTPRSSHGKATVCGPHGEALPAKDTLYSVINKPRRARPLLSQLFGDVSGTSKGGQAETRDLVPDCLLQNGPTDMKEEEYELVTVNLSKNKQSLGK